MRIDRAGIPFIVAAAVPGLVLVIVGRPGWAFGLAAIAAAVACFFRDPERSVPDLAGAVVAPADGRVTIVQRTSDASAPPGTWLQIAIFLSPLDVHINRVPVGGRIARVEHRPGGFLPAYRPEAARNEQTEVWIDRGGQTVIVRQIVGILARRVVCRLTEGQDVQIGERFGLMKFGSRMDVFLPPASEVRTRIGDRVRGGETILAILKP